MNNKLFRLLYIDLDTPTSSLCYMVLLETFPTSFLGEVWAKSFFFFSGLTAGPTYRPPVRHSNPDTPLPGVRNFGESIESRGIERDCQM